MRKQRFRGVKKQLEISGRANFWTQVSDSKETLNLIMFGAVLVLGGSCNKMPETGQLMNSSGGWEVQDQGASAVG